MQASSVDSEEIRHFSSLSDTWWDEKGPFRLLHRINPLRLGFIRDHVAERFGRNIESSNPFAGLSMLDVGCGGGLLCEPITRLGASVTGIDATPQNIAVASLHAEQAGVPITYLCTTAEDLLDGPKGQTPHATSHYDFVLALEIIEHVADTELFIKSCASLVKPGGMLFLSTINRTFKSLMLAKIGAEYILRWVPRGTHHWRKFMLPSEVDALARANGLKLVDTQGMVFSPLRQEWKLTPHDTDVNYFMAFEKRW